MDDTSLLNKLILSELNEDDNKNTHNNIKKTDDKIEAKNL